MYINSANSYIDVIHSRDNPSTFLGLVSESGQIEFFMFASTQGPKRVVEDVSIVTGYAPLPAIYTMGFHYSEWAFIDAGFLKWHDFKFESGRFPYDVLWMDIQHGGDKKFYFSFDDGLFPNKTLTEMNKKLEKHERYFVVVTDPHLAAHGEYNNYLEASELQINTTNTSIFTKSADGEHNYLG